ncbi:MAG: transketolase C-terminal domain-containing protein [Candidatus Gottesmanbacteria bacterium]|nr:transketolase C-terminal domain-containing protein [Candidatus Gottesmanbacteria bacterium]
MRTVTYAQAINEAQEIALTRDPSVFVIGEGVPDAKGIFGTTIGLAQKFPGRVMDMPVAENGMTGICVGAAISGMRPIMVHARMDFTLMSFDAIVNTAAKWYFMFGQKQSVPLVIRMVVGRGWGPGPQHSQSLQALFAHIPGLKVVMPAVPADAKGLLLSAIGDNNPVIFIEHRWLHALTGDVPKGYYEVPIGNARVAKAGRDVTIVAASYMTIEAMRAAEALLQEGIAAEVVDLRSIRPLDRNTIVKSVQKTHRLIVADTGWKSFGIGAEIVAMVAEAGVHFAMPPVRIALPDMPTPTSPALAGSYYPTGIDILRSALVLCGRKQTVVARIVKEYAAAITEVPGFSPDQPDPTFTGPF